MSILLVLTLARAVHNRHVVTKPFWWWGGWAIGLSSRCHCVYILYIYRFIYIYINEVIYHVPQFMSCLPQGHFGDNREGTFFSWSCFHDLFLRITGWTNTVFVRYSEFHDKWFLEIQLTSVFYVILWKCVFVLVSAFW